MRERERERESRGRERERERERVAEGGMSQAMMSSVFQKI